MANQRVSTRISNRSEISFASLELIQQQNFQAFEETTVKDLRNTMLMFWSGSHLAGGGHSVMKWLGYGPVVFSQPRPADRVAGCTISMPSASCLVCQGGRHVGFPEHDARITAATAARACSIQTQTATCLPARRERSAPFEAVAGVQCVPDLAFPVVVVCDEP